MGKIGAVINSSLYLSDFAAILAYSLYDHLNLISTMKSANFSLFGLALLSFLAACNKNSNPAPPIHDTVTVVKTDTVTVPPPPDPTVNLTQGLLLYLPFNGSIADSSGNNNPTYADGGDVLTYDAHGYANSAFGGNGTGQRVIVTNNGSIQFDTAYSLSFDFMTTVSGAVQRQSLLTMVDTATGVGVTFNATMSVGGTSNIYFGAADITLGCTNALKGSAADPTDMTDTSIVPQLNTWYNVICIYHKGAGTVYVNGQVQGFSQSTGTAANLCSNSSIVVGGWWNGDPITLNGKMDEVRVYNRVLTPHEITALSQHYQVTSESVQPRAVHR
jgi:Concanavalin A-like lectin/glucanases superfamily